MFNQAAKAEKLMDDAFRYLSQYDSEKALKIGKQLQKMRYSGAFEILALAHEQQDNLPAAIASLEDGVKTCPQVWRLWQLLGNFRSDAEYYDEAMRAYDRALACQGADTEWISLNKSICLSRSGRFSESIEVARSIEILELSAARDSVIIGCLISLDQFDEAISVGESIVERLDKREDVEQYVKDLSRILAHLARAYRLGKNDSEKSRELVNESLRYDKSNVSALATVRELNNVAADDGSKLFKLVVEGEWPEPVDEDSEASDFFSTFWVVAASADEALSFVKELEPITRDSLKVHEFEGGDLSEG
ncbi:MAG: hypothetical protein K2Z81_18580, partial [Cyanobacteria bacterium]|nr:hypothetical protein [Cyanobacteriota bacterium]